MKRMLSYLAGLLSLFLLVAADAGSDASGPDAGIPDASPDAAPIDAGSDAGSDAGADGDADGDVDTDADVDVDTDADSDADAAVDAGGDAASDSGTDASVDAGPDASFPCDPVECDDLCTKSSRQGGSCREGICQCWVDTEGLAGPKTDSSGCGCSVVGGGGRASGIQDLIGILFLH